MLTKNRKLGSLGLILAFTLLFGACSEALPPETLPLNNGTPVATEAETDVLESEIIEETTEETTSEVVYENSTAVVTEMPVPVHGQLSVSGTQMVDQNGDPIQLKGMSTYGLHSVTDSFINENTVQTLAEDWGCTVLRLAMYTMGNSDGYIADPDKYFNRVCNDIDLCINQGIYVIVDWHILFDGDPLEYEAEAIDFFDRISAIYGDCPNVLYEICNEPNGNQFNDPTQIVDWENCVKPYAETIVATIRANDPDNIIIIGSPTWSQDVDIASQDPVEGENLMYTVHFYAGSHGQELRDKITTAINNGLAIFCTEWGTTNDSGNGNLYIDESIEWLTFLEENGISWCNWSIGGSSTEKSNALKYSSQILTIEEKLAGHWPDNFISNSGLFVRCMILGIPYEATEN